MVLSKGTLETDGLERFADQAFGEPATYTYHINLDERGSFYADVRNSSGKTVFEIKAGNELGPDETSIFEDGFMRHTHDMDGLKEYLVSMGVMSAKTQLVDTAAGRRSASVPARPRMSRMVIAGSGVPVLIGGVDEARIAIAKDGFDPSQMVVASYAADEAVSEPEFPTDSRAALAAHVARCRVSFASMSETGGIIDAPEYITYSLGLGSPAAGWRKLMEYASRQDRRVS
jgi:hypothetical protein